MLESDDSDVEIDHIESNTNLNQADDEEPLLGQGDTAVEMSEESHPSETEVFSSDDDNLLDTVSQESV